jgi:predicted phage tail protein
MRCVSESSRISETLWRVAVVTAAICISTGGYSSQIAAPTGAVSSPARHARATTQVGASSNHSDTSTVAAALSPGNSAAQPQRPIVLTWKASTSVGVKYNVYRSATKGECLKINSVNCQKINLSPVPNTTYTDNTVQPGQSYFYVAKAVDSRGKESNPSNEAQAVVSPPKP